MTSGTLLPTAASVRPGDRVDAVTVDGAVLPLDRALIVAVEHRGSEIVLELEDRFGERNVLALPGRAIVSLTPPF